MQKYIIVYNTKDLNICKQKYTKYFTVLLTVVLKGPTLERDELS
jgi:hypothetical protein